MQHIIKIIALLIIFGHKAALALHPAQFSQQISQMLNEAGVYPALEVELDFMFDRQTMRTTQRKLQQVRLARKHEVSEFAETARKKLLLARRLQRESYWIADDAMQAGEADKLAEAIGGIKEKLDTLQELKDSTKELASQWNDLEKQWTLMSRNDFAQFAEKAFFQMVRRQVYESENRNDPRLVPILLDDLNYYTFKVKQYLNYLKRKINQL